MSLPARPTASDLAIRREQLLLRSAQLRERLRVQTQVLRPALRAADRVRGGVASVREHPGVWLLVVAAVAGAALVRPRLVVGLGLRAWSGWQMFQRVRPVVGSMLRALL